jgi:hypothetical protein
MGLLAFWAIGGTYDGLLVVIRRIAAATKVSAKRNKEIEKYTSSLSAKHLWYTTS